MAEKKDLMRRKTVSQNSASVKKPESIDEYIDTQPDERQSYLRAVRDMIRTALPEAEERISWGMPTFWNKHNIIHFAGFQKHIGLYPGTEALVVFAERLKDYKTSKGSIQFLYSKPLPLELIGEIAKWCAETGNHP